MLKDYKSVVAFGGGTGLGRLLAALSFLQERLTGVVTTTDDGGSTGRLRDATGCIAWGDLRNCFNQICAEPTLGRLLFEYRFADSGELSGHNLGNLMLFALDQLTARPLDAINLVRDFLNVKPKLLPMSEQPASLQAATADGTEVRGETAVAQMSVLPDRLWLSPAVSPTPEVMDTIANADLILLGPGSFITSVMPSLLVDDIQCAVLAAPCKRVLIANLIAEPGPVGALSLSGQIQWMAHILGGSVVDAVLWPASRCLEDAPSIPVHVADVASPDERHEHTKLAQALATLLK